MNTVRCIAPITTPLRAAASTVTANGRTYVATAGLTDLPACDADIACSNGWKPLAIVGTTAQRPILTSADAAMHYLDLSLGKLIVWQGAGWIDPATGAPA